MVKRFDIAKAKIIAKEIETGNKERERNNNEWVWKETTCDNKQYFVLLLHTINIYIAFEYLYKQTLVPKKKS